MGTSGSPTLNLLAVAVLSLTSCGQQSKPPAEPIPLDRRPTVTATTPLPGEREDVDRWCPGGLLCEDPKLLLGYRVPWACGKREERTYVARCWVDHVEWIHITEFFGSRYGRIEHDEAAGLLTVTGHSGVVKLAGAATGTTVQLGQPATLIVKRHGNGIEVTATRGSGG